MMNTFISNVTLGWLVASLALIAEHLALWERPWRLSEPWNYVVGVLTILAGCAVWAWRQAYEGTIDPWLALIAFMAIGVGSGGWVVLAYALRGPILVIRQRGAATRTAKTRIAEALNDNEVDDLRRN